MYSEGLYSSRRDRFDGVDAGQNGRIEAKCQRVNGYPTVPSFCGSTASRYKCSAADLPALPKDGEWAIPNSWLHGEIGDLRRHYGAYADLNKRILGGVCLVDNEGRAKIRGTNGLAIRSAYVKCQPNQTVEAALRELNIDRNSIGTRQIRIFKKNQILQNSRDSLTASKDEILRIIEALIEPGDVILILARE